MRVPRVYVDLALAGQTHILLPAPAADHVVRVLRLRAGAELLLFDGTGGQFRAALERVRRSSVEARLLEHLTGEVESPLATVLVQGVSRGERMDYTLQKAVELGVWRVVPVFTERSMVALRGERLAQRQRHWEAVTIAACEQSGRNRLPVLESAASYAEWLDRPPQGQRLVLDPRATAGIGSMPRPDGVVTLVIGPEGGLTQEELAGALRAGCLGVRLGPRVLRTETAAVAALAALQTLWGDLG